MMLFTVLKECVEKVLIPNVHQNLFSIISHPSLSCLAPSLSIAFHLHCSTPFASVEKRWVSLYSYRASCNLCSDISYFSGFFVSFVYRKRYSNTKKIFYFLYSHLVSRINQDIITWSPIGQPKSSDDIVHAF